MNAAPLRSETALAQTFANASSRRFETLQIWSVSIVLAATIATTWMNQRWLTGTWELLLFICAGVVTWRLASIATNLSTKIVGLAGAIPFLGMAQLILLRSSYNYATILSTLDWFVLPACLLLGLYLFRTKVQLDTFLLSLWWVAGLTTALELDQLLYRGRYSVMSNGYPLMSSNFYAELSELVFPVIFVTALSQRSKRWAGFLLSAVILATTVASAARTGAILLMLEAAVILVWYAFSRGRGRRVTARHVLPFFALCAVLVALEGSDNLASRLRHTDSLEDRGQVAQSAMKMIRQRPLLGYGLGSFPVVYPQFASFDSGYQINHTHNDYLEIGVDAGLLGLLIWAAFLGTTIYLVRKIPWAIGLSALCIHGLTDFPIFRPPVAALLALLVAAALTRAYQAPKDTVVIPTLKNSELDLHVRAA